MSESTVRTEREGRVVTITVDRPPLNIFDIATIEALHGTLAEEGQRPSTDVIVLKTAGTRIFSAGVEVGDHTPDKVPGMLKGFHDLVRLFLDIEPVSVCEVQAAALGGGAEVALACDLVVAAEGAKFAFPEIELACYPPVALATLPYRVGPQRAADLVLTGSSFSAKEAHAMGLVNRLAPKDELAGTTARLVDELTSKSPTVLKLTARHLRNVYRKIYNDELQRAEEAYLAELCETDDMKEGIQAFIDKRKPEWKRPE